MRILLFLIPVAILAGDIEQARARADAAYAQGDTLHANAILDALITAHPGNIALAATCLDRIRAESRRRHLPNRHAQEASDRILALRRAGLIADDHHAVSPALHDRITQFRHSAELLDAERIMDDIVAINPDNLEFRLQRARFHQEHDSLRARSLFHELVKDLNPNSPDPMVQRVWQQAWESTGRLPPESPNPADGLRALLDPEVPAENWAILLNQPVARIFARIDGMHKQALDAELGPLAWHRGNIAGWTALEAHLRKQPPRALAALRVHQQALAQQDRQRNAIEHFRRYPWAPVAQQRLLGHARQAVWDGRPQAAARSFRDVLARSIDPALLDAAHVGLWAALALLGDIDTLDRLVAAHEGRRMRWRGGEASAGEIRAWLSHSLKSPPVAPAAPLLAELRPTLLELPTVSPWPQPHDQPISGAALCDIIPLDDGVLLASRNILARYPTTGGQPIWAKVRDQPGDERDRRAIPGPIRPLITDSFIITRGGYLDIPSDIYAYDRQSGDLVWSTVGRHSSDRRHAPISDPVLADGRLFYLEISGNRDFHERRHALVCLNATDGTPVWRQTIDVSAQHSDIARAVQRARLDFAIYGNRVTIADGAVYSNIAQGIVARNDIRDGRTEWLHFYKSGSHFRDPRYMQTIVPRGTAPILHDDRLILAPRDCKQIFALDPDTGLPLWRNPFLLPQSVAGFHNESLIVRGAAFLAALDPKNGELLWRQALPPEAGHARLIGNTLFLQAGNRLQQLNPDNGQLTATRPVHARHTHIAEDRLYTIRDTLPPQRIRSLVLPAGPAPVCHLPLNDPALIADKKRFFTLSEGILRAHSTADPAQPIWQRFVPGRIHERWIIDGALVLHLWSGHRDLGVNSLIGIDCDTGANRWHHQLPSGSLTPIPGGIVHYDGYDEAYAIAARGGSELWRQPRLKIHRDWPARTMITRLADQLQLLSSGGEQSILRHRNLSFSGEVSPERILLTGPDLRHVRANGNFIELRGAKNWQGEGIYHLTAESFTHLGNYRDISSVNAPYLVLRHLKEGVTILREDDPDYAFSLSAWSKDNKTWTEDRLVLRSSQTQLYVYDLPNKRTLLSYKPDRATILGHAVHNHRLQVVTTHREHGMRMATFDLGNGDALSEVILAPQSQALKQLRDARVSVIDDLFIVTSVRGLQAWQLP